MWIPIEIVVVFINSSEENITRIKYFIIFTLIFIIINLLFFYYFSYEKKRISRLDIVYSNNYDRIFIGLVNKSQKAYTNKFTFYIDSIEQFILESIHNSEANFYLKGIMKNKEIKNICRLDEYKAYLEGLLLFLNQRLNII